MDPPERLSNKQSNILLMKKAVVLFQERKGGGTHLHDIPNSSNRPPAACFILMILSAYNCLHLCSYLAILYFKFDETYHLRLRVCGSDGCLRAREIREGQGHRSEGKRLRTTRCFRSSFCYSTTNRNVVMDAFTPVLVVEEPNIGHASVN